MLFCVLFLCKCVLYYCHRVATQLQLTHISYHISRKVKLFLYLRTSSICLRLCWSAHFADVAVNKQMYALLVAPSLVSVVSIWFGSRNFEIKVVTLCQREAVSLYRNTRLKYFKPAEKYVRINTLVPEVNCSRNLELRHPRCVCNIRCRQGSQTQQCILTYITVELHNLMFL